MKYPEDCEREFARYGEGKTLRLVPHHTPTPPYGFLQYARPKLEVLKDIKTRPSSFDPEKDVDPRTIATIKIVRSLSGGLGRDAQVLLCELVGSRPAVDETRHMDFPPSSPGNTPLFVAKVFDPMLFRPRIIPPHKNFQLADQGLSREASALRYLYDNHRKRGDIMGHPYLVPEYYGAWAIEINLDDGETRYVGAVLMEYIRGSTIEKLCFRDAEGFLHPRDYPIYSPDTPAHGLIVDEDVRKEAVKKLLEGFAVNFHIGVEHHGILPRNLAIVMHREAVSKVSCVVLLDYSHCQVFEKTIDACSKKWKLPCSPIQLLPHPPHPFETFDVEALQDLNGWIPLEWELDPAKFDVWLQDKANFGPVVEGDKWSVFDTYLAMKRKQDADEKNERKRKREEAAERKKLKREEAAESRPAKASRKRRK